MADTRDDLSRRIRTGLSGLSDNIGGLQAPLQALGSKLDGYGASQAERDERIAERLAEAHELLLALAAATEQQGASQAERDGRISAVAAQARALLAELDAKAASAAELGASTATHVMQLQRDIDRVLAQGNGAAAQLGEGLAVLGRQLEQQHARLGERVEAIAPVITGQMEAVTTALGQSASHVERACLEISESQRVFVTEAVQKELGAQLLPLQKRTRWLAAVCTLSLASTLGLLALMLLR